MMVTLPIVANTVGEEEEEVKYQWCEKCQVNGVVNCIGIQLETYTKYCSKNYGSCTVTVAVYRHAGFCSNLMCSLSGPHDHTEYHTHYNCVPTQGICQYY